MLKPTCVRGRSEKAENLRNQTVFGRKAKQISADRDPNLEVPSSRKFKFMLLHWKLPSKSWIIQMNFDFESSKSSRNQAEEMD